MPSQSLHTVRRPPAGVRPARIRPPASRVSQASRHSLVRGCRVGRGRSPYLDACLVVVKQAPFPIGVGHGVTLSASALRHSLACRRAWLGHQLLRPEKVGTVAGAQLVDVYEMMASNPWVRRIEAIVLRTVNDRPSLWDAILPSELSVFPMSWRGWTGCSTTRRSSRTFASFFDARIGRPSVPMETYLRMMFLKFRYRLAAKRCAAKWAIRFPGNGSAASRSALGFRIRPR